MSKFGIHSLLRQSHRLFRGGLGALWLGLLVFQSLNGSSTHCSNEMQSAATGSGAAIGDRSMHTETHVLAKSVAFASMSIPVDSASMPLPTQSLPCHHAAMTATCHGCTMVVAFAIADVSLWSSVTDGPIPWLHTARSQLIAAPDAPPPKV